MDEKIINKVFNEDCLVGMDRIPDKSIDCIICDLPYGKLKHLGWDNIIPFDKLWEQYNRIAKDNAAVLLFGVEPFTSSIVMSNVNNYRQKLTWLKTAPTNIFNAKKQFMNWTEDIIVFYRSLPTFNPQMVYANQPPKNIGFSEVIKNNSSVFGKCGGHAGYVSYNDGYVYPSSVLKFGSNHGWLNKQPKYHHPTQKPVDLIRYLIRTYTNSGDIVLDNCMGSGTTAIAALREGRKYIGFELDKKYYEMTQQRIAEEKDYIELTDNKLF
jgi:site-specific DNA-methyltransferase (adenine-specific)